MGSDLLLVDEDQCATNFMMRDRRMELLVHKNNEPITPFFYQARSLYLNHGVSNILVVGGLGSYFSIADAVVMLRNYECLYDSFVFLIPVYDEMILMNCSAM